MQRLDDVTGDPVRLSARERETQREAMIAMINAQTRQLNLLTAELRAQRERADNTDTELSGLWALVREHEGRLDRAAEAEPETFWQRLCWLVRGR